MQYESYARSVADNARVRSFSPLLSFFSSFPFTPLTSRFLAGRRLPHPPPPRSLRRRPHRSREPSRRLRRSVPGQGEGTRVGSREEPGSGHEVLGGAIELQLQLPCVLLSLPSFFVERRN
jgi:hypothetical protein